MGVRPLSRALTALALLLAASSAVGATDKSAQGNPKPPGVPGANNQAAGATLQFQGKEASSTGLLVKLKNPRATAALAGALNAQLLKIDRRFGRVPGLYRVASLPGNGRMDAKSLEAKIKGLKSSGLFEYVEPDWRVSISQVPTDTAFANGDLWGLQNTGQGGGAAGIDINAVSAWSVTTGSPSVIVGVVDTGVRHTHQDLAGNMWTNPGETPGNGIDDDSNGFTDDIHGINAVTNSGDPMDDNDHGTHVAGTIAASANDTGPHVGVAYNVKIMGLKFIDASGSGNVSDAITCIDYAIDQGVDILNNSWGGTGYSQALRDAIQACADAGILFIAAAGNSASDNDVFPFYPSSYAVENVVAVAAIDRFGLLANFSNYGAQGVDIGAPGVAIYSCTSASDTSYAFFDGTSMAAPHVAGVAALLASQHPSADVAELKNRILMTAVALPALSGRVFTDGMADAHAALTVAPDSDMELRAHTGGLLVDGAVNTFYISVTDVAPVTGATVTGSLDGAPAQPFLDDGVNPDEVAGDAVYTASLNVSTDSGTTELTVDASASGKNPAQETFAFTVYAPPENDDFENRINLVPGTVLAPGANRLATQEPGEALFPSTAGGKTVWWEWTAPATGNATIDTHGSDYDTTLAIHTGETLGALSIVDYNDDDGFASLQSSVTFSAVKGTAYKIQVDGYNGAEGNIQLNYPSPGSDVGPPIIINHPTGRTVVLGDPFTLTVSAVGAAPLGYAWRLDGTPIAGANQSTYTVSAAANADEGTYTVLVTNAEGSTLSNAAYVAVDPVGLAPGNDMFANAIPLTGIEGQMTGSNIRATGETGEPNHAGASASVSTSELASAWYKWTAPANGTFDIITLDSDFDTTLAAYTGTSVSSLTEIASNDDFITVTQSAISFPVTGGQEYMIAVDGFDNIEGNILLTWAFTTAPPAPANDDFENSIYLGTGNANTTGNNAGATGETGEPDHAGSSSPNNSVWWNWTPELEGSVTISTSGSSLDTTLAVYTGNSVDALTEIASNDDIWELIIVESEVIFNVVAGTTYHIAVDGWSTDVGNIALGIVFSAVSGPEIAVDISGIPLQDGTDTIDFGQVAMEDSAGRTFTVRNVGSVDLTGLALSMDGANASDFSATGLPATLASGGSTECTLTLAPSASGPLGASLHIASNDSDENPFDVALTGSADTALDLFLASAASAGLTEGDQAPEAMPFDDNVENILKYAFNMPLDNAAHYVTAPGGASGLPNFSINKNGSTIKWKWEYLRRKGSGITYTPMYSLDVGGAPFAPMSGTEAVTDIDELWESVVLQETIDLGTSPNGFGYIEVALP